MHAAISLLLATILAVTGPAIGRYRSRAFYEPLISMAAPTVAPSGPDGYRTACVNNGSPRWDRLDGALWGEAPNATISGRHLDYAEHELLWLEPYLVLGDNLLSGAPDYEEYNDFCSQIAAINSETVVLLHFNIGDQFKFEKEVSEQEGGALRYSGAKWIASIPNYRMLTNNGIGDPDSVSLYNNSWECDVLTYPALRTAWVNFTLAFLATSTNGAALNLWPLGMDGLGLSGLATGYRGACAPQPAGNGRPLWTGANYCANVYGMVDLDYDGIAFELDTNYYSTGISEIASYRAALLDTYSRLRSAIRGPLIALNEVNIAAMDYADGVLLEHFPRINFGSTPSLYYRYAVDPEYSGSIPNLLAAMRTDRGGPYMILSCQKELSGWPAQLLTNDIVAMMFDGVYCQWTNFNTSGTITDEGYGQLSGPVFNTRHTANGLGPVCFGAQLTYLGQGGYWFDDSPDSLGMRLDAIGQALGPATYLYEDDLVKRMERHFTNGKVVLKFMRSTWYDPLDYIVIVGEDTVRRRGNSLRAAYEVVMPLLLSGHLNAGGASFQVTFSVWNTNGAVRYALRRTSDSAILAITDWSQAGITYDPALQGTGASVGTEYELMYWLDCQPDFPGYVEEWKGTGVIWTQPAKGAEFDTDFEGWVD